MRFFVCNQCGSVVMDKNLHGKSHAAFGTFYEIELNLEDDKIEKVGR